MNAPWIQAGGFENVLPFIILILWVVGKVLNARAEGRSKKRPGPPPLVPDRNEPSAAPAESGEEQLRRFLAELTGTEPPPVQAPPPPEPLPAPPALPEFRPPQPMHAPMATSVRNQTSSPDPFSLRRSLADRHRKRRPHPAAPPPVPVAAPASPAFAVDVTATAAAVTSLGPQARRSVMPASGLQAVTMAGPHLGSIGRGAASGRAHAAWEVRGLLAGRRRLREAMILRTILAPPRALDPI